MMSDRSSRFGFWAGTVLLLLLSSALAAQAVFWATGRSGAAPCGEDAWRWGLAFLIIEVPAAASSFLVGIGAFVAFRKRLRAGRLWPAIALLQLAVALIVVVIAVWPNVVYVAPPCE